MRSAAVRSSLIAPAARFQAAAHADARPVSIQRYSGQRFLDCGRGMHEHHRALRKALSACARSMTVIAARAERIAKRGAR